MLSISLSWERTRPLFYRLDFDLTVNIQEFTIAHMDAKNDTGPNSRKRGICILSEFSSCTRVMRGALHVNPWKISEIATAFYQALTMSDSERIRRVSIASEFVTRVTTQRWALAVMLDLKGVMKNEDAGRYAGAGLGLGFRLLGMDSGFNSLDVPSVSRGYRNAISRLILLDYGGTILANDNVSPHNGRLLSLWHSHILACHFYL